MRLAPDDFIMADQKCYYCNAPIDALSEHCPSCRQPLLLHGRYRLERVLGMGGFSVVYAARDMRLNRLSALKGVASASLHDQRRIEAEASLLSQYASQFPFIPDIYDIWSEHGQTYMVMEYIDGEPLNMLLGAPWPAAQVEGFLRVLLGYLVQLHAVGIVHRDLKPQNIIRTIQGRFVLLDFGIAKQGTATITAAKALSPGYAPPEQFAGQPTDARSDLYSLAATAYHLLIGRPPPSIDVRLAATGALSLFAGSPLAISPVFEQALCWMLELDPAARPANAEAVLALLDGAATRSASVVGAAAVPLAVDDHGATKPAPLSSLVASAAMPTELVAPSSSIPIAVALPARAAARRRWLWALAPLIILAIAAGWGYQARTAAILAQATATAQAQQALTNAQAAQSAATTQAIQSTATAWAMHVASTVQALQFAATAEAARSTQTVEAILSIDAAQSLQATAAAQVRTPTRLPRRPTRTPSPRPTASPLAPAAPSPIPATSTPEPTSSPSEPVRPPPPRLPTATPTLTATATMTPTLTATPATPYPPPATDEPATPYPPPATNTPAAVTPTDTPLPTDTPKPTDTPLPARPPSSPGPIGA